MAVPVPPLGDYSSTGDVAAYIETLNTASSTAVSATLGLLITRVSRMIDLYCGRRFWTTTGDEVKIFDGPRWNRDPYIPAPGLSYWYGSQRFMPNIDIASSSQLTTLQLANGSNDAANGTYVTIDNRDYSLEPTDRRDGWPGLWLEMNDSPVGTYSTAPFQWFSPGKGTIKITGRFGWNSTSSTGIPADIQDCATQLVVRAWRARDVGFSDVIGIDQVGASVISKMMPSGVRFVLDMYRRINVV